MRERLHAYTKRTLGAGGSYNDAVREINMHGEIIFSLLENSVFYFCLFKIRHRCHFF